MVRLLVLGLCLSAASAFTTSLPAFSPAVVAVPPASTSTARYVILSNEETESILNSAKDCAEGECTVDEVSNLISELKEQEQVLEDRLDEIMNMIAHLQHINEKDERKKDEVQQFVKDMLRVFSHEESGFAMGFSGDIGDGPKTAYDALPPKPWKPAA